MAARGRFWRAPLARRTPLECGSTSSQQPAARKSCQPACKPGSVWRRASATAIHLGRPLLDTSCNQPGLRRGPRPAQRRTAAPCRPYSVLLPVGFTLPPLLPEARCALTAPFHPCCRGRARFGGLLSVALSLGLPPAAVSRHRRSMEPGLSSTGTQPCGTRQRPSGRLTCPAIRGAQGPPSRSSGDAG